MKKITVFLVLILTGCATYTPKPTPMPCEMKVKGECREMTAGEKSSAVVRGHGEDVKEPK